MRSYTAWLGLHLSDFLPHILVRNLLCGYVRYELRQPVSVSSFPTYYPDTGTGSCYPNRTCVGLFVQPLFKQASRRLTMLHTCDLAVRWSQPANPTRANALLPRTTSRLYTF